MPKEWKYNPGSMLKTVESMQKVIKDKQFAANSEEDKRELYASLFASRSAVNAERGKKKTLKASADVKEWTKKRDELILSPSFQAFVTKQGHENMKKLLTDGHGGAAEKAFQEYVLEQSKLPSDVPERYMPTAKERIEQQKEKLAGLSPSSDAAAAAFAEIFRTRRAVDAVRKKSETLEGKINGKQYAQTEDLSLNEVFRGFVRQNGSALKDAVSKGNGGAAEDLFKEHLLNLDHIPQNAPAAYMPTAYDRTEKLKEKLEQGAAPEQSAALLTELMAAREAVNAVRKKPDTLKKPIPPAALHAAHQKWSGCAVFQQYLKDHPEEARKAGVSGHGGQLQDSFREHVKQLDQIPADVPADYMPTAYDHLEALKAKYEEADYYEYSDERKLTLAVEIMAAREAVEAVRGKADSLKKPLDPARFDEARKKWMGCRAFREYIQSTDAKTRIEVRDAAHAGHGGALGDKFREYLLDRDVLEADIPEGFMPTALERTEALKKKLEENRDMSPERRKTLYTELMATRSAVQAVRKKSKSLEKPLDPDTLKAEREKLEQCEAFQSFLKDDSLAAEIQKAAVDGHGGALEDKFKEYVLDQDHISEDVPARYMPTALERTEALQKKIAKNNPPLEEEQIDLYAELMGTREAVGAKRKDKDSLDVVIDPARLKTAVDQWKNCQTFRTFAAEDDGAKKAAAAGHGGLLEDKFREYVKNLDVIPEDVPEGMLPDALERTEALQQKIKETQNPLWLGDEEDELALYAQLLATRSAVGAVRKDKDSLKKQIDPKTVNKTADDLTKSQAFKDFFTKNKALAQKAAAAGHGGELEDMFKYYVSTMIRTPADVPREYMPTAAARIEGLQDQIRGDSFRGASLDTKTALYAELLGARRSVGAQRKKAETLDHKIAPKEARETSDALIKCSAFKKFIQEHPEEAKKAALSGHAGALEDAFKDYVLHMDAIPEDVPKEYMPTALERTEVLQKKIKSGEFEKSYNVIQQAVVYKELMATRAAAESIRGEKSSLNAVVDPKKLEQVRKQFRSSDEGTDQYLRTANRRTLRDAALSGHGGALEDLVKEDCLRQTAETGSMPKELPERYRPTAAAIRQATVKSIHDKNIALQRIPPEQLKKQVAAIMVATKLEKEAERAGAAAPKPDPAELETQVNKLMGAQAFQDLFKDQDTTRLTRQNAAAGKLSSLFEAYNRNETQLRQQAQLRQQQLQAEQQRQNQNQPQVNQDQPQVNQNQPQVNQDQPALQPDEENRRRRANSMRERQNPVHQL